MSRASRFCIPAHTKQSKTNQADSEWHSKNFQQNQLYKLRNKTPPTFKVFMISQDQSRSLSSFDILCIPWWPSPGKALMRGVFVDLRGTQLHDETNREAHILLQENVMRNTSQRIYSRPERGYSSVVIICYKL